jgi:hypothetical protein
MSKLSLFCPACGTRLQMIVSLVPAQVDCLACKLVFVVNPSMAAAVSRVNGIVHETISPLPPPPITKRLVRRRNFRGYLKAHYWSQIAVNMIVILLLVGLLVMVDAWVPQSDTFSKLLAVVCIGGVFFPVFNIAKLWRASRDIRNL